MCAVTAADLQIKFSSDTKAAEAGIDRMNSKVKGLGGVMKTALGTAGGFLLGGAVQNLVGGFGQLVKGGLDFEAQMANVNSIAQLSDSQIKTLSASVNSLATDTAQAPQTLAAGLYDIYSSGFQGAEALDILGVAAKGATAGMTDTATASGALVGVLNSGIDDLAGNALDAQGAMDILFKTVELGVITFPELANNMAQTLAPANALGISLEELGAAYALMTKQAIPAAQAETAFANLMKVATNPTDELTAAVNDFGYESAYALVQAEGLPGLLGAMAKATGGNAEELRKLLPDAEAFNAALALLGEDGGQTYLDMLDEMDQAAGATDKALTKQSKSAAFAMKQAKIAFQQSATVLVGALSPAIQLAARGFAFLATEGITPAFELFGRILDPIGRFAGLLREAFGAGQGVDDLFNVLFGPGAAFAGAPQMLQDAAREMLNVADALGDMKAAFDEGGISGLFDVINEEVGNIADSVFEIGTIIVSATFELVSNVAGDIWGWIKEQLFGPAANEDPMLRGLGGIGVQSGNSISVGDVFIAVGELVIQEIGGWGADAIPTIQTFLDTNKLSGFTQIINIESFLPAFEAAEKGDYETAIFEYLTADPIEITPNIELKIKEAIEGIFAGGGGAPGGGMEQPDWSRLAEWLQVGFQIANPMSIVADDIAIALREALTGALNGMFSGPGPLETIRQSPWGDAPSGGGMDFLSGVADTIIQAFKDLPGDIVEGVGTLEIDIDAPDLPSWLEDFGWITDPLNDLIDTLTTLAGGLRTAFGAVAAAITSGGTPNKAAFMPFGMGGDAPGADLGLSGEQLRPQGIEVPVDVKPVVNSVDWSVVQDAINPFGSGFGTGGDSPFGGMAFTANLDLDKSAFDVGVQTAQSLGDTFDSTTYVSTFDIDNGPAALKYTAAYGWGDTWAAALFASTFDIDNGPAAIAYTEAFGWGNTWADQVFTASFAVDTSGITGAVDVARQAAQDIADLLPNSPAKKGPLAKMPNFDYIADAARATFDGMGRDAERGLSALSDRYGRGAGGAWGAGAAGVTVNVTAPIQGPIYGIDDFEDKVETMFMGPLQQALILAYERQRRANGER